MDYFGYSVYVLCYGAAGFVNLQGFANRVLGAAERADFENFDETGGLAG